MQGALAGLAADEPQPAEEIEPLEITVRQLVPVLLDLSAQTTDTLTATGPLILDLDLLFQFTVTQTLTSTVPASITLQITDLSGAPVRYEMGVYPLATVEVVRVAPITVTEGITETPPAEATEPVSPTEVAETEPVTETVEAEPTASPTAEPTEEAPQEEATPEATPAPTGPVGVAATAIVTANLRGGPGLDAPIVGSAGAGEVLDIVAVSTDGDWFLLVSGAWVAEFLVQNPPPDLPVATPELIESLTAPAAAETPAPEATPTPTEEAAPEATPAATEEPTPEPTPAPAAPVATVDANLRSGPGTQFPIIGGTLTGQVLNIVGQNADGSWFLLDNGGWIAAFLVANPPTDVLVIPITAPAEAQPAPAPAAPQGLPTPTPVAGA